MIKRKNSMQFLKYTLFFTVTFLSSITNADEFSTNFQLIRPAADLSLHKEMFMLPLTYSNEYNKEQTEAVFQISAKHRLFNSRFYFGYTQISFWQAYDQDNSAPFRETNYNPEIFYRFKPKKFYSGYLSADAGIEHESNGQRVPFSRSWNLIYITPYYFTDKLLVHLKLRYRIPEKDKEFPGDPNGDDNPDITDFLGHSDLNIYYKLSRNRTLQLTLRGNLRTGHGIIALNFSIPIPKSENSYFITRFSHGFGESMVDYNRELTRIGIGVMFSH